MAKRMKNQIYHFAVPGHPCGRQEPQKGAHGWFTPAKTKKYYEHIRNSFQQLYPRLNDRTHDWKLTLDVYVNSKKFSDLSNVIKACEDALQGCIWHNDKQIWHTEAHRYMHDDECVVVRAEMMDVPAPARKEAR